MMAMIFGQRHSFLCPETIFPVPMIMLGSLHPSPGDILAPYLLCFSPFSPSAVIPVSHLPSVPTSNMSVISLEAALPVLGLRFQLQSWSGLVSNGLSLEYYGERSTLTNLISLQV